VLYMHPLDLKREEDQPCGVGASHLHTRRRGFIWVSASCVVLGLVLDTLVNTLM